MYIFNSILYFLANKLSDNPVSASNPGECTLHARHCSGGIGVFFLVQNCYVLFVHGSFSSYFPSLYLDVNGESDHNKGQNRPMHLSLKRYAKVEEIYRNHMIPNEIARNRATKDTHIRLNWY
jgi:E3 ubiquitin-protein ligase UBR1